MTHETTIKIMNRTDLKTYEKSRPVFEDIDMLNDLFLSKFKKKSGVALCYGVRGTNNQNTYVISAHWENNYEHELNWMKDQLS